MIDSISDAVLVLAFLTGLEFSGAFAFGRPRTWFHDPLGWVIFLYSLAVDALLFLIVFGIVFGQKVDEPYRVVIAVLLWGSLLAKRWILHTERKRGRQPFDRIDSGPVKIKKG